MPPWLMPTCVAKAWALHHVKHGKFRRSPLCNAGLAGERSRWEVSIVSLEAQLGALPGDVALASAFMSYAGPFPSQYREDLAKHTWQKQVPPHGTSPLSYATATIFWLLTCIQAAFQPMVDRLQPSK